MSLARIARSVLNARSDFSIAVMTPVTSSVFPVARSSTALLASCWSLETSSMLCLSVSAKEAPDEGAADLAPVRPSFPMPRLLSTPLIMGGGQWLVVRGQSGRGYILAEAPTDNGRRATDIL